MAKTFTAKITPSTIEKNDTATGVRYSKMQGCTIETRGKRGKPTTMVRTVMAFGRANAAVANILRAGKTIEVQCQYDGGTIRVLGKAKKAA